ncbi:MAG: LuxR family transcriptional regulator [Rhodospirillaceae bacterium]|jgi:LuxR family transcriptional regulator, activator of conjugal transfer of Ti plasmids|nr:LuxR family transcriptional regulator [Rhodospirillaceae bacterium]MBT5455841.1 LuxR family transcriptional regulator [Rhodospirillaceae bacterium]
MSVIFNSFIESCGSAKNAAALEGELSKTITQIGFDKYAYIAFRGRSYNGRPYVVTNYPEQWHDHYSEQGYVNKDPVIATAQQTITPLNWRDMLDNGRKFREERRVIEEASEFGMLNGVTIPIHGPRSDFATLTVASDLNPKEFQSLIGEFKYDLHLLSLYFHDEVMKKVLSDETNPTRPLSPRERECLLWTAQGKTSDEIASIVGISQETVVFHLKNAMRKFNVYSKHHAVVKAIISGTIAI